MLAAAKKSTAAATLQQHSWRQKANRRECGDVGTEQEQLRQQQTNNLEWQTRQRRQKEGAVAMMSVVAGSSSDVVVSWFLWRLSVGATEI
jgi:hypothetical protein